MEFNGVGCKVNLGKEYLSTQDLGINTNTWRVKRLAGGEGYFVS